MKKKDRITDLETELMRSRNAMTTLTRAWKVDRDMVTTLKAELAKFVKCDETEDGLKYGGCGGYSMRDHKGDVFHKGEML